MRTSRGAWFCCDTAILSKLGFSLRMVPPAFHLQTLPHFKGELRPALAEMVEQPLQDDSWNLEQLRLRLRDVSQHAAAAYLASVMGSRSLCARNDPLFDPEDICGGLALQSTIVDFNSKVLEAARVSSIDSIRSQSSCLAWWMLRQKRHCGSRATLQHRFVRICRCAACPLQELG